MLRSLSLPVRVLLFCALLLAPLNVAFATALPFRAAYPPHPDGAARAAVQPPLPDNCQIGDHNGYQYWVCTPRTGVTWNQDLIIFVHGYMSPQETLPRVPTEQLLLDAPILGPVWISDILTGRYNGPFTGLDFRYAFAVTSYTKNGLAVKEGVVDVADLAQFAKTLLPGGTYQHVYLLGFSEGGLITTLSLEQSTTYTGGIAVCGPIGDFRLQTNYFGDFRAVFDYFFPGLMPGEPTAIPLDWVDQTRWDAYFQGTIVPQILAPANQNKVTQLLRVTAAPPYQFTDAQTVTETIGSILWYSVFATNDATTKLGGQPYENWDRIYAGSDDDAALNAGITSAGHRYHADLAALTELNSHYQTSGIPLVPLVTVHTTRDQVVPYQHESLYMAKVLLNDRLGRYDHIPVDAYGHCKVDLPGMQTALATLLGRVANPPPLTPSAHLRLPLQAR